MSYEAQKRRVPASNLPSCSPNVSAARHAALSILISLAEAPSRELEELLDEHGRRLGLDERDRRLTAALVLSVLRHASFLDWQYRPFLRLSPTRLGKPLQILLRLVGAQHFFFDRIPPHAIVHDAVELARQVLRLSERDVRFLNAVARKVVALQAPREPEDPEPVRRMAARWSVPTFLAEAFVRKYGKQDAERLLRALSEEPQATLRVNVLRCSPVELVDRLTQRGIPAMLSEDLPSAVILGNAALIGSAVTTPEFRDGLFYMQDCASQLVGMILAPQAGERILDLCAAPGGKTTHVAELARGAALVVATDRDPTRLERLRENVARLQTPNVEIVDFDRLIAATVEPSGFDAVLVDAPCSALGTIRRHPEIRWRIKPGALRKFTRIQLELLELAARLVRPHGRIVYSTCSPMDEENRFVVDRFLEGHSNFAIESGRWNQPIPSAKMPYELFSSTPAPETQFSGVSANLQGTLCSSDGFIRTWPHRLEWDGFEIVVLRRRG